MAGYSGDAGDAMTNAQSASVEANGMMFSTPDSDNDLRPNGNTCATINGWWYRHCSASDINRADGVWVTGGYGDKGVWTTGTHGWDVVASRMLVKLN